MQFSIGAYANTEASGTALNILGQRWPVPDWFPFVVLPVAIILVFGLMRPALFRMLWQRLNPQRSSRRGLAIVGVTILLAAMASVTAYLVDLADRQGNDWLAAGVFLGACVVIGTIVWVLARRAAGR